MVDFNKLCRACNSEKCNLLSFYTNDEEPTLGEMYSSITMLELNESDGLPEHICYSCAKKLEVAYSFQKSCQKSEKQIRSTYEKFHKQQSGIIQKFESSNKKVKEDKNEQIEYLTNKSLTQVVDSNNHLNINTSEEDITKFDQANDISIQHSLPVGHIFTWEEPPNKVQRLLPINKIETLTEKEELTSDESNKSFICDACDKRFFTKIALILHKKQYKNKKCHTAESEKPLLRSNKTFHCKLCDVTFSNLFDLKKHYENHSSRKKNILNQKK